MTTQFKVLTEGVKESLEAIEKAGKDIDDAVDVALLASAKVFQAEMIRLAPERTGNLKRHIQIKGPIRDGNYHFVEVGVIHDIAYTDAETARYANVQEYGSADTPAHPYIRPAIDTKKREARAELIRVLKETGSV
jgi:HK97 gp10 family phage protein